MWFIKFNIYTIGGKLEKNRIDDFRENFQCVWVGMIWHAGFRKVILTAKERDLVTEGQPLSKSNTITRKESTSVFGSKNWSHVFCVLLKFGKLPDVVILVQLLQRPHIFIVFSKIGPWWYQQQQCSSWLLNHWLLVFIFHIIRIWTN